MAPRERLVMAAYLLFDLHRFEKKSEYVALPPDALVSDFVAAISTECADMDPYLVPAAAQAVYDRDERFRA